MVVSEVSEVADLIRRKVPEARTAHFMTSDQHTYGFVLSCLRDADGEEVDPDPVDEAVSDLLRDMRWDGPMRENARGYAVLDLESGRMAPDGV
jgi:hypothetical protein